MTTTLDRWAAGTLAALDRQTQAQTSPSLLPGGGSGRGDSLEQENARLREQLRAARDQIAALELQLQPGPQLVNMTEAAALLDVHISTISRWVAQGHFQTVTSKHRVKPLIVRSSLKRPPRKRRQKGSSK